MSGEFISLRTFTHRSLSGHSVHFERNKPTFVPPLLRREVLALGCVPADVNDIDTDQISADEVQPIALTDDLREALLFAIVAEVMEKEGQNIKLFNAGGAPKAEVLEKRSGITPVSNAERDRIVGEYREAKGLKHDYPKHPAVAEYRKVLAMQERRELEPYAEKFGVKDAFDATNLAGAKNMILRCIVGGQKKG